MPEVTRARSALPTSLRRGSGMVVTLPPLLVPLGVDIATTLGHDQGGLTLTEARGAGGYIS